ncbi:hypothetical protein [Alloyangia pacifica]|uniref:hypothetical protein n=1 Tax=Alloyangia pacifica TaxID=311180 RepID=UPI001CFCA1FE|nr:hypothetical protein [Alloyangia pacifica]
MNQGENRKTSGRIVSPGGGFAIACITSGIGVLAGILLWRAGVHPLWILLTYIAVPAVMLTLLYVLTSRGVSARCFGSKHKAENDRMSVAAARKRGEV